MEMMNSSEVLAPTQVRLDKDYGADIDVLLSLVPNKMAFKIGEVSEMLGLKNHVLRYWETEFPNLKPKKSNHNQRMYTIREIEMLLLVRKFLYVDKFSISGARKALRNYGKKKDQKKSAISRKEFLRVENDLVQLIDFIKEIKYSI